MSDELDYLRREFRLDLRKYFELSDLGSHWDLFKEKYKEAFNKNASESLEEYIKAFKDFLQLKILEERICGTASETVEECAWLSENIKRDEHSFRRYCEDKKADDKDKNSLIKELIARVEIVENKGLYESIDALAEDIVTLTDRIKKIENKWFSGMINYVDDHIINIRDAIKSIEDEGLYNLAKGVDDLDDDIISLRDRIEMIEDEEYTVRFDNLGKEIKMLQENIKMLTSKADRFNG